MRSIWSGSISLSFLNVPVSLGSTTHDSGPELHQVRRQDGSRIRYRRYAEADGPDGPEVPYIDVVRGYVAPDGPLVTLTPGEMRQKHDKTVSIVTFTSADGIPPLASRPAYWVEPDRKQPNAAKAYALLADSLQASGKVAIVKFAMRDSVAVAVLRPVDGYLAVEPLEFAANLVKPDFAAPENTATEAERKLMLQVIDSMSGEYDHAAQADQSAETTMALIQSKIERGDVRETPLSPARADAGAPQDFTAVLQAAVEAQKAKAPAKAPAKAATPAPRRRTAARKVAA